MTGSINTVSMPKTNSPQAIQIALPPQQEQQGNKTSINVTPTAEGGVKIELGKTATPPQGPGTPIVAGKSPFEANANMPPS
jgi:hypothetical protein